MKFTSLVPTNRGRNIPIINYLAARFTYLSRPEWITTIKDGKLSIDGTVATEHSVVNGGQSVIYDAGEIIEPPADLTITILYEDEWLLVINKPGNLLIHRAGKSFTHNLMYQLRYAHTPPYPESHSVHRLDRNTSGTVLVAKNSEIQAALSALFKQQQVEKRYLALVEGQPASFPDIICQPIGPDPETTGGSRFRIDPQGKEAITRIVAIEPVGSTHSLLTLAPLTGRTHQLRVHLASIGHPIFGDRTYGSTQSFKKNAGLQGTITGVETHFQRHALHCSQLEFYHPWKSCAFSIKAELPEDMREVIKNIRAGT